MHKDAQNIENNMTISYKKRIVSYLLAPLPSSKMRVTFTDESSSYTRICERYVCFLDYHLYPR